MSKKLLSYFYLFRTQQGFTLVELIAIAVILGIIASVAIPNLFGLYRENEARKAYIRVKNALTEAQVNANRLNNTCTIEFTQTGSDYFISGEPSSCLLESFTVNTNVVSLTKTNFSNAPTNISFSFIGTTPNASTLWITRKSSNNQALENVARCIVVSSTGMIRTGFNRNGTCNNVQNQKYDNSVQ